MLAVQIFFLRDNGGLSQESSGLASDVLVDLSGTARVKVVLTLPKDIDKAFKVTTKQYLEALKTYGPTIDKEKVDHGSSAQTTLGTQKFCSKC